MLNGLFNKRPEPTESDFAQEPHKDGYEDGEYKPGSTVHTGGAEAVASTTKVLPEKNNSDKSGTNEDVNNSRDYGNRGYGPGSNPPVIKTGVVVQGTAIRDGASVAVTVTAPEGSPFLPNR